MSAIEKIVLRLAVAILPAVLQGCGTLAAPQVLALSMASSFAGGYANGGLMAGSTVGVIHNAAFGDADDGELQVIESAARTAVAAKDAAVQTSVAVVREAAMPQFANGLERACYFPNASGRGLPCT